MMQNSERFSNRTRKASRLAVVMICVILIAQVTAMSRVPVQRAHIVLDRYVDDTFAVLLVGPMEEEWIVPRASVAGDVPPGTWLHHDGTTFTPDKATTAAVRARIAAKLELLRTKLHRAKLLRPE